MRKLWILMIVLGSGLAAFGFSEFDASIDSIGGILRGGAGWDRSAQIEITVGVTFVSLGILLYKESRLGKTGHDS